MQQEPMAAGLVMTRHRVPRAKECSACCRGKMRCKAEEHPLVYAEPPFYSKDAREQIVERLFESFSSPAVFLAKNPVLASFALGRQTSLVVDIGYDATIGARRNTPQIYQNPQLPVHPPQKLSAVLCLEPHCKHRRS